MDEVRLIEIGTCPKCKKTMTSFGHNFELEKNYHSTLYACIKCNIVKEETFFEDEKYFPQYIRYGYDLLKRRIQ